MNVLSLLGNPPGKEEVEARQRAIGTAMDAGERAFWMCPVPVLDVAVGMAAAAVDEAWHRDERAAIAPVAGAVGRDWSATRVGEAYVPKVRGQGRELMAEEIAALDRYAGGMAVAADSAGTAVSGAGAMIGDAFDAFTKGFGARRGKEATDHC